MILPKYLEKEIYLYCKTMNIPISRSGDVPEDCVRDIEDFIDKKLKADRKKTRLQENVDRMKISNIMKEISGKLSEYSPIEDFLYEGLKNHKLDQYCERQHKIGTKIADFAFPAAKLVVEADGREYHFTDQSQIERDQERDKYLARKGWRVLHIEGLAIRRNIDLCIDKIKQQLKPFIKGGQRCQLK